MTTVES